MSQGSASLVDPQTTPCHGHMILACMGQPAVEVFISCQTAGCHLPFDKYRRETTYTTSRQDIRSILWASGLGMQSVTHCSINDQFYSRGRETSVRTSFIPLDMSENLDIHHGHKTAFSRPGTVYFVAYPFSIRIPCNHQMPTPHGVAHLMVYPPPILHHLTTSPRISK